VRYQSQKQAEWPHFARLRLYEEAGSAISVVRPATSSEGALGLKLLRESPGGRQSLYATF